MTRRPPVRCGKSRPVATHRRVGALCDPRFARLVPWDNIGASGGLAHLSSRSLRSPHLEPRHARGFLSLPCAATGTTKSSSEQGSSYVTLRWFVQKMMGYSRSKSVTAVTATEAGAWHAPCAVAMEASSCSCRSGQVRPAKGPAAPCRKISVDSTGG